MTSFMKEFEHLKIRLEEVKRATNNFDKSKVIGSGGFGDVFKGEVSHSKGRSIVAFKRLDRRHGQGDPEFLKEIMMLSRYIHENLISLVGYCDERDEKILVYEYASNGSLDHHLGDPGLTWTQRLTICLGAAEGLTFLHDPKGAYQRVLHRDIKSANILLDENFNAKVADFGLAKMCPANQQYSYLVTGASGTVGYCDPQYMASYTLTKESDVYSFGVVLFEVLSGKLCFQFSKGQLKVFVPMWKKCYTDKNLDKIIFQDLLIQEMDPTSLETFSNIAFQCLHEYREERPTMSVVVEKLELALTSQKLNDNKLEKIVQSAVDPLVYRSIRELKGLLSKGLFLNKGKMWFSLNDKAQHCLLISIDECIGSYNKEKEDYSSRYSHDYNSRFQVGSYNTRCRKFDTRVSWSQFLTPGITYTMNLVFKCPELFKQKAPGKQEYIAIRYRREKEKEKRISIVHVGDKREDEWLKAGLYQFTAGNSQSNYTTNFLYHKYFGCGLVIEGIEFQPLEKVEFEDDDQVLRDEYREILEAAAYRPLLYRSVHEFKLFLSRGILLNEGRTWFYLNDKRQHCEMISMNECLILDAEEMYPCASDYNSRFPEGALFKQSCKFRTRVKAQFLTPYITYTVNLVFKFNEYYGKVNALKQRHIGLRYKLDGDTKTFISHLAYKREDNWWMVELCQFPSDGKTVDIQIIFQGIDNDKWIVEEGIEFHPLEKDAEHQVLEDKIKKEADMQIISDSDDTMRTEVSNDYVEDMIKW